MTATERLALAYLRHVPVPIGKRALEKRLRTERWPSPRLFTDKHGLRYELFLDQYLMRKLFLYGASEPNTTRHLPPFLSQASVVFDCGANIGTYTLFCAKHAPQAQVHAFEPLRVNLDRLSRNIALNGLHNITTVPKGVSAAPGEADIFFGQKNSGASLFRSDLPNKERIALTTIDAYCEEQGIAAIDVLKIDVEGAEALALQGARNVLARSPRLVLVLEIIDRNQRAFGSTGEALFASIRAMGFRAFLPKAWPRGLRAVDRYPGPGYVDNIVFLKGW